MIILLTRALNHSLEPTPVGQMQSIPNMQFDAPARVSEFRAIQQNQNCATGCRFAECE